MGRHKGEELGRYIDTGKLATPREEVLPYNPLAMEMIAKNLEAQHGGKK